MKKLTFYKQLIPVMAVMFFAFAGCDRQVPFKDAPFIPSGPANIQVTMNGTVLPNGDLQTIPDTAIGTQRTATITIRNLGAEDLEISDVSIVGDLEGVFSFNQSGMEYILAAGVRTSFTATFTPVLPGTYNITMTISNNDADPEDSAYTIPIAATAVVNPEPEIEIMQGTTLVDPSNGTWFYPIGDVNTADSVSVPFTINNTGSADLGISVSINGTGGGMFSISTTGMDTSVAGGGDTLFNVVFHPTAVGDFTATVTVSSNDADEGEYIFTVTGSGVTRDISVILNGVDTTDDGSYDIGESLVGSPGLTLTFTITNTEYGQLEILDVALDDASGQFTLDTTGMNTLLGYGETAQFTVTYKAGLVGPTTASLVIQSDDPDTESVYSITLTGTGVVPDINVIAAGQEFSILDGTGSFDFGNVIAASGSLTETFIIQNLGGAPLTLSSVTMNSSLAFSLQSGSIPIPISVLVTVPAYGEASFTVRFAPGSVGSYNTMITILNDDPDTAEQTYTFAITGTGVNAEYYVDSVNGDDIDIIHDGLSVETAFKTITHAVAIAPVNAVITVLPGTYDEVNGESFPITLRSGQSLIGDTTYQGMGSIGGGTDTVIYGNISSASYPFTNANGCMVMGEGSSIQGFYFRNMGAVSFVFGVYSSGAAFNSSFNTFDSFLYGAICNLNSGMISRSNLINSFTYGYYVYAGSSAVRIYSNTIENTQIPMDLSGTVDVIVSGNKIGGSGQVGIQSSGDVQLLRNAFTYSGFYDYAAIYVMSGNTLISKNVFESDNGVRIDSNGVPNMGTDPKRGNNDFSLCSTWAIQVTGTAAVDISAIGNKWYGSNPIGNIEVLNPGPRVWYGKGETDFVTRP